MSLVTWSPRKLAAGSGHFFDCPCCPGIDIPDQLKWTLHCCYSILVSNREPKMRRLLSAALFSLLLPISSAACAGSVVEGCGTDALELRRDFAIEVKDAGKPVPGVSVRVTNTASQELFSGVTAADGAVRVKGFAAGQYWLRTEILGMFAGGQCFRVGNRKSTKAKEDGAIRFGRPRPIHASSGGTTDWQSGRRRWHSCVELFTSHQCPSPRSKTKTARSR